MSPSSPRVKELLAANAAFAKSYTAPVTMKQIREASEDAVIVVTCMDPRVVPEDFVGPRPMVAVFRNAGGRYSPDLVRTIVTLRSISYKAKRVSIMVVHHTDCGMTHLTDDSIREDVKKLIPEAAEAVQSIDFGCFTAEDLNKSVLEDVKLLKAEKILEGLDIRGYVLSTETGLLQEL